MVAVRCIMRPLAISLPLAGRMKLLFISIVTTAISICTLRAAVLRLSKSKGQPPPDIPVFLRALAVTEPVVVWDEAPAR